MKKIITMFAVVTALTLIFASSSEKVSEAQVIVFTHTCCDNYGNVRCFINATPVGNPCFCYGQGYGYAC